MIKTSEHKGTLFLDRDGVINKRIIDGYVTSPKKFIFLPHAIEGIQLLSTQFNRTIIITNQQGVGKGLMTLEDLGNVHRYMLEEFKNNGITIHQIYVATNLKGAKNDRRKPQPQMGLEAQKDFPDIQFEHSLMIGDTESDIQFGKNLGMKTALITPEKNISFPVDFISDNLKNLAHAIK